MFLAIVESENTPILNGKAANSVPIQIGKHDMLRSSGREPFVIRGVS